MVAALALTALSLSAAAAPTTITVRAVSRDAKVLGDGVGGARITIREADSGKILATGIQSGGTGDTKKIMQEPRPRGGVVYGTDGAAAYRATIEIAKPTRVEIIAEGPLKYSQAMQRVSKTMLLFPGQNIEGEGVLLELHGFIVDIVSSATQPAAGQPLHLRAKVTMTCGCPTEPGGLWDAGNITVTGRLLRDGVVVAETPLRYAGETSTYEGQLASIEAGSYEVEVLAGDAKNANFGRATFFLTVPAG